MMAGEKGRSSVAKAVAAVEAVEAQGMEMPQTRSDSFWDAVALTCYDVVKGRNFLRVEACTRGGKGFINVREYFEDRNTGEWRPGKQGITIDESSAADLETALVQSIKIMRAMTGRGLAAGES